MSKKHVFLSFRTTLKNQKHLKSIKSKYNLTIGDIIHRMIEHFADSGDAKDTIDKLMKQMAIGVIIAIIVIYAIWIGWSFFGGGKT